MARILRSYFSFHPIPNRPHVPINDFHTEAFLALSNSENIGNGSAFSLSSGDGENGGVEHPVSAYFFPQDSLCQGRQQQPSERSCQSAKQWWSSHMHDRYFGMPPLKGYFYLHSKSRAIKVKMSIS